MSTLQEQAQLELDMVDSGIAKFKRMVQKAEQSGAAGSTGYATRIISNYAQEIAEDLKTWLEAPKAVGSDMHIKGILRKLDPLTCTYLALQTTINCIADAPSAQNLGMLIGKRIEYEAKFAEFAAKYPELMASLQEHFDKNHTDSAVHKIKVLTKNFNSRAVQWTAWGVSEKCRVGLHMINLILKYTDMIQLSKATRTKPSYVLPTESFTEFTRKHTLHLGIVNPERQPCIIPPCPWEDLNNGGFYTPKLRGVVPLVKYRNKEQKKMLQGDLGGILTAVNGLQGTTWAVNTEVLDVIQQVWVSGQAVGGLPRSTPYQEPVCSLPPDLKKAQMNPDELAELQDFKREVMCIRRMEQERVSKCYSISKALKIAHTYKDKPLWFVYQCDFRGRMYAFADGLSPQGGDPNKALLKFYTGKPLGTTGLRWLRIHGANCFGVDKVSFEDRVQWVLDNETHIKRVAEEPLSYVSFWEQADKPWQFLAFCFEYNKFLKQGLTMLTHLPVGVDGSCNGLQNYSALLRDPIGGACTNLVPADKPQDIYAEVSKVCTAALRNNDSEWAKMIVQYADTLGGCLPRGAAKRPVMTLPYGSTRQSCRDYVYQWLVDETGEYFPRHMRWKVAHVLSMSLWESMGSVVVAARVGMDWLQTVAGMLAKVGKPLVWWSPVGFPVYQARFKIKKFVIKTILTKPVALTIRLEQHAIDPRRQKTSSAPNFVHSLDAAHAMLTLNAMQDLGINDFSFIHDDFGTHACDVDTLSRVLREQFVLMYTENKPLLELKNTCECALGVQVPDPPKELGLDITQVLESKYFFA